MTATWRAPDLPIRRWLPDYERRQLRPDLVAAAMVTALTVPQALGYAAIAGVPVQVGLYAVPVALVTYALLGSSPQLNVGPVSTVSVVSGSLVALQAGGDPERAVALTVGLALLSGVFLILAGTLRLGWVAEFLSKPIVSGFVLGLSILIILGELPPLLGLDSHGGNGVSRLVGLVVSLPDVHAPTAVVGAVALGLLFGGRHLAPQIPWGLIVVVGAVVVSARLGLGDQGVVVVGEVPRGLPRPGIPDLRLGDYGELVIGAAGLALVGLAESLSAARLFATQGGYRIEPDQEFVATGAANLASGLFGGLGVAGSLSKTAAVVRAGGTSQITGLAAAGLTLGVLVLLAPGLAALPRAVLAAIVIHAVWGLIDLGPIRRYARVRRNDLVAAVSAIIGVLVLGTLNGLLLAVSLSVLGLIYRSGRVEVEELGRIRGEKAAWGSVERHPERRRVPHVLILRLNAPLFWVNAASVEDQIITRVDAAPDTRVLILDLEATNQLDTTSADVLQVLLGRLKRRDVELILVRVMHPVRAVLRRTGMLASLGTERLWHTISEGVAQARRAHDLEGWLDEAPETVNRESDPTQDRGAATGHGREAADSRSQDREVDDDGTHDREVDDDGTHDGDEGHD